jgi:hypothetical protein
MNEGNLVGFDTEPIDAAKGKVREKDKELAAKDAVGESGRK